jgi:hypothetical protein
MTYFENLAHDGTIDSDGDGHTDRQEFLAGTDPTDNGSVFMVISVTRGKTGAVALMWAAQPGRLYQVQSKRRVEDANWSDAGATVAAVGSTASSVIAAEETETFYRVVRLP